VRSGARSVDLPMTPGEPYLGENGRLQPVGAFPNGLPLAYRIVDPALYILQVKFDL